MREKYSSYKRHDRHAAPFLKAHGVSLASSRALFERDLRETLAGLYFSLSADAPKAAFMKQLEHKKDAELSDIFPSPQKLPYWLTSEDLDYYVEQYKKSGFRGPINWYRDLVGVEELLLFPGMPGDSYDVVEEQMARLAEEVLPLLS